MRKGPEAEAVVSKRAIDSQKVQLFQCFRLGDFWTMVAADIQGFKQGFGKRVFKYARIWCPNCSLANNDEIMTQKNRVSILFLNVSKRHPSG